MDVEADLTDAGRTAQRDKELHTGMLPMWNAYARERLCLVLRDGVVSTRCDVELWFGPA
jgi:hypothetical protein